MPVLRRHALNTLPELAKDYINTGKIRYVFRNLPLESIHPTPCAPLWQPMRR